LRKFAKDWRISAGQRKALYYQWFINKYLNFLASVSGGIWRIFAILNLFSIFVAFAVSLFFPVE